MEAPSRLQKAILIVVPVVLGMGLIVVLVSGANSDPDFLRRYAYESLGSESNASWGTGCREGRLYNLSAPFPEVENDPVLKRTYRWERRPNDWAQGWWLSPVNPNAPSHRISVHAGRYVRAHVGESSDATSSIDRTAIEIWGSCSRSTQAQNLWRQIVGRPKGKGMYIGLNVDPKFATAWTAPHIGLKPFSNERR